MDTTLRSDAFPPARNLDETLARVAALIAGNETELAVLLHRHTLADLTVGELVAAGKPRKRTPRRRHLHAVPLPPAAPPECALLSMREMQVIKLVAEGLSNKQIGANLRLSDKTIKNHISHILTKLALTARTQVAVYALRRGLC